MPTLYETLRAMGADLDSHESDLYVKATPETRAAVKASGLHHEFFSSPLGGGLWIDVFGAWDPFWTAKRR